MDQQTSSTLNKKSLTTTALVFMIIAASAPLTVLAGGVPTNYAVSGLLGVPLSYLVLGLVILLFAVGYVTMSRHVSNAGAFYAYVTEGMGNRQGIAAAILALVSYNMMQIGLYGLFGFSLANLLNTYTGLALPWWFAALFGWLCVGLLGLGSIDLSVKVLGILVGLEFFVVLTVSVISLSQAPEGISMVTFAPKEFLAPGIGVLFAFGIAAFMGFESGAIYSEEAKERGKTVARATYIAVAVIALFYAYSSWAFTLGVGPSRIIEESAKHGPDLVFVWLSSHSVVVGQIANLLYVTSLFAALLAFHNAAARYFYSLGRSQVLPKGLSKSSKDGAPAAGSLTQSSLALVVLIGFAIAGLNSELGAMYPVLTLFTWLTNAAAFGLVFLLAVTSAAIILWARRHQIYVNLWNGTLAPGIAAIVLSLVALLILWNFDLMIGAEAKTPLVFIMPGIILLSGIAGLLWGEYLRHKKPEIYHSIRHLDQSTEALPLVENSQAASVSVTTEGEE